MRRPDGWWVAALAVTALGAALRFWGLGRESLWLDEAYSWDTARTGLAGMVARLARSDLHPPLHFLLLKAASGLFGAGEAALRLPSALAGSATVLAIACFGRDAFGPRTGLVAATLVALSPFALHHAQEARPYALLLLLSVLSMHAYWRQRTRPARRARIAYVAATALMLWTHAGAVYVVAAQAAHWGAGALRAGAARRDEVRTWLGTQAIVALAFLPWAAVTAWQARRFSRGFWIPQPELVHDAMAPEYSPGGALLQFAGGAWLAVAAVALAAWGSTLAVRAARRRATSLRAREGRLDPAARLAPELAKGPGCPVQTVWLLLAWLGFSLGAPYLQSLVAQPVFLSRVAIPALAPFLLLAASPVAATEGRAWRRVAAQPLVVAGVLLVAVLAALMASAAVAYHGHLHRERWREAFAHVDAHAAPNATVLLVGTGVAVPQAYYTERQDLVVVPVAEAHQALDATQGRADVWMVWTHTGDPLPVALAIGEGRPEPETADWFIQYDDMGISANPVGVLHWRGWLDERGGAGEPVHGAPTVPMALGLQGGRVA